MEMKVLKENKQDENGKSEHSKLVQTHPGQITLEELAQGSPR